jgi:hypothetical protein
MGDQLIKGIYQNQDLTQIKVFPLFSPNKENKGIVEKLKGIDISIIGEKSQGTEEEKAARREMLAQVIAIMWKLYDMGRKQGEDARSASYKLIDPEGKVYAFLRKYVSMANQQNPVFAYERNPQKAQSSHYKSVSPESQWGVDVRFYANQASLGLLPYGKSHLLFGKLSIDPSQPNLLFVKFEDYGIAAPSETVLHGIAYLRAQLRSASEKAATRVENTIRPEIVREYLDIVSQLSPQEQAKFKTDQAESVRDILLTVNAIVKELPQFKTAQEHLLQTLNTLYPNDKENLSYRTGNEIIIDMRH